jgi:DNA helicase-2/ATP-dependent DNA helicase PcrA
MGWGIWGPSVTTDAEAVPALPTLKAGDKVRHATFGDGIVVSCLPSGQDYEVTVAFTGGAGVKRLLLSYAHLEKLG